MQHPVKLLYSLCAILVTALAFMAFNYKNQPGNYIIEHEESIKKAESGPHKGGGKTTAFSFFGGDQNLKIAFRKRVLHPGSSIGYHLQEKPEIYYILSGQGILTMNGKEIPVKAGDAILTNPGNHHGLRPAGDEDLTLIINYEK